MKIYYKNKWIDVKQGDPRLKELSIKIESNCRILFK